MFETLLVATDGSKAAEKAVTWAVEFAKRHDSKLVILNVTPGSPGEAHARRAQRAAGGRCLPGGRGRSRLLGGPRQGRERWPRAAGIKYELDEVYGRNIAAAIAKEAMNVGAEHIIIGSTGVTALVTCVLGSVAQNVVHYAHCPVTVVR